MMKQGYSLEFKDNICTIYDQQDVELLCVKMKSKSFKLDWEAIEKQAYFETVLSVTQIYGIKDLDTLIIEVFLTSRTKTCTKYIQNHC